MRRLITGIALMAIVLNVYPQEKKDSALSFSLQEAQQYALTNNVSILNAIIDQKAAKQKVWETTAMGLPQVSVKGSYSYSIKTPNSMDQFSGLFEAIGGLAAMHGLPVTSSGNTTDFKNNEVMDLTVGQLIFSGAYLVGLQTSKAYKSITDLATSKSKADLVESVTNSYYMVLIARAIKTIVDNSYTNTESIYKEINAQYKEGFVEETMSDQLKITLSNLNNTSEMLARQVDITEKLLKFQLGMDFNQPIILKDSIEGLINNVDYNALITSNFVLENNIDYKMLLTQEKLMKLNLKYRKSECLPTISGFYLYHKQFNKDYFDFQPSDMVGISASMPLFTSGQNLSKISQAKLQLIKAQNTKEQAGEGILLDYDKSKSEYISALNKMQSEKENVVLAKKIYNQSIIKFKEGIISGLELTQAQNQYLTAQSNYYAAISEMIAAKSKMEKLINNK